MKSIVYYRSALMHENLSGLLPPILTLMCCFYLSGMQAAHTVENDVVFSYIDQYKDIAMNEMARTGIPASIKLAQGILESNSGRSHLAVHGNNHFGMKCGGDWNGRTVMREDDDYKEGKLIKSCFRAYASPQLSYKAHSEFLMDPKKDYRYGPLFDLDPMDYRAWAHGLKKAGYATAKDYAERLISLIERYSLHQYDQDALVLKSASPSDTREETPPVVEKETKEEDLAMIDKTEVDKESEIKERQTSRQKDDFFIREARSYIERENNKTSFIRTSKGDNLEVIALETGYEVEDLLAYNDHGFRRSESLPEGTYIYTDRKKNKFKGSRKTYRASSGESAFDIAQKFGIRLKKLKKRNRWDDGHRVKPGEVVYLRGKKKRR